MVITTQYAAGRRINKINYVAAALAKGRVGESAGTVARLAHQVHGAIGFTKEYALQLSTRRLWSWREEFGPDPEWAARVGAYFCARGAETLWPTLTAA